MWENWFWFVSWARFRGVNKDVSKISLTVLKLKLDQKIEEAIVIRNFLFKGVCRVLSGVLCVVSNFKCWLISKRFELEG